MEAGAMHHLGLRWAILVLLASGTAWGQGLTSSQMQTLVEGARPLSESANLPPHDPVYQPLDGIPEAPTLQGRKPAQPLDGLGDGQWGEYQPPDYADGISSVGPCCETCGGGSGCYHVWSIRQYAFAWGRNKARGIQTTGLGQFVTQNNDQVFVTPGVMGTRTTAFDVAGGYGAAIQRYWRPAPANRDLYLEADYFGMNTWREHREFNATQRLASGNATYGNLFTPFTNPSLGQFSGIGGFDRADHHEISYESRINNVEFNIRTVPRPRADRIVLHPNGRWRRECQPGIYSSYLFGVRYFSLNEQFNLLATGHTDFFENGVLTESLPSSGTYDIDTFNDMLGIQFGMDLKYRRCLWEWGGEARAVPCVNFASQRSHIVAHDPATGTFVDEFLFDREDNVAFLGQVSVVGEYHVAPSLTLRASYDFMWLIGVAMAAEQLKFQPDPSPRVNTHGTAYYQGLSLGLTWSR